MKYCPKDTQRVWFLVFEADGPACSKDIQISSDYYKNISGWKFNTFESRKDAQKAKREIVGILRGVA